MLYCFSTVGVAANSKKRITRICDFPVGLCEWKNVHATLTVTFKNFLRTIEAKNLQNV